MLWIDRMSNVEVLRSGSSVGGIPDPHLGEFGIHCVTLGRWLPYELCNPSVAFDGRVVREYLGHSKDCVFGRKVKSPEVC